MHLGSSLKHYLSWRRRQRHGGPDLVQHPFHRMLALPLTISHSHSSRAPASTRAWRPRSTHHSLRLCPQIRSNLSPDSDPTLLPSRGLWSSHSLRRLSVFRKSTAMAFSRPSLATASDPTDATRLCGSSGGASRRASGSSVMRSGAGDRLAVFFLLTSPAQGGQPFRGRQMLFGLRLRPVQGPHRLRIHAHEHRGLPAPSSWPRQEALP